MTAGREASPADEGPVPAHEGHRAALARLRRCFIESQLPFGYRAPAVNLDEHVKVTTTKLLASSHHHLFVLEDCRPGGDNLAGYVMGLRKLVPGLAAGRIGSIEELYVTPDHRGAGIGGRLHAALVRRLAALGVDRIEVQVLARNDASVRFWQRAGYTMQLHVLEAGAPV